MSSEVRATARPASLEAFRRRVDGVITRAIEQERRASEAARAATMPQVRAAIAEARRAGLVGKAWLFGSFAWGVPGPRSDIDLIADAPNPIALASFVGERCNRQVHVVALERAPSSLRDRALGEGLVL